MRSKSHRASRLSVIALSAALILFGLIFLTLIHISSLPAISTLPIIAQVYYLVSAFVLVAYFFFEWRNENCHESRMVRIPDLHPVIIVVVESLSEKILRWIITTLGFILAVVSLGFVLICTYGTYKGAVQPQIARILIGELLLIGTVISIFVAWKILSSHRRKLLHEDSLRKCRLAKIT
jgi:hypothetical protein